MDTTSKVEAEASERPPSPATDFKGYLQGRLVSLDVFRGITIALMILVNNPGGEAVYGALQHADWNGWTLADLVFPFFLFIVGVAIPYSFTNRIARGDSKKKLLLQVVRRTVILFALGLIINAFPYFNPSTLRIMGVLQRIALCYFFSSIIFLAFNNRKQVSTTVFLPLFYWALMTLVPVPGYGTGVLGKEGNLAAYLDNLILGTGHLYGPLGTWDPEGLLSTIPAVATTLIGVLAGKHLISGRSQLDKAANLLFFGSLLTTIGTFWDFWFPINKNLWTSSYVALSGGIALILLAACYYVISVKGHVRWTKPFIILGVNAIAVYFLSEIVNLTLFSANVPLSDGKGISLKTLIYQNYFESWAGPLNGSLIYAFAYLVLWVGIMAVFYKRRTFIKI
jgi:predicted acyltransferase